MPIDPNAIRIAVVDDEKMILDVFSSLMRQFHYHADFFPDSQKAFKAMTGHSGRYDLLITDICMPDGDGVSFAKRIREIYPDLPIMFMTGSDIREKKAEALTLPRVAFLEKPFPLVGTLKEMISKFLEEK